MLVCVLALFQRSLRGPWRAVFCQPGANLFHWFRQSCVKPTRSSCVRAGPAQSLGHPRNASTQPDIAAGYLRSCLKSWSYGSAMHSGAYARAVPGHEKPVRDGRHVPGKRRCRQWPESAFRACRVKIHPARRNRHAGLQRPGAMRCANRETLRQYHAMVRLSPRREGGRR